jgi:D-hexose-6-phosphate mutarotase
VVVPLLLNAEHCCCCFCCLLQGATITRWLKEDGTDLLFTRSDAVYEEGEAIK